MIDTALTAAAWTAILLAFTLAVIVPGPDTFLILRLGVRERRAAMLAACGIMIGNLVWTGASVLGLAALMRALPGAIPVMQALGSAVLVWIGVQSVLSGLRTLRSRSQDSAAAPALRTTSRPLLLGIVTNMSNPKALLFFTALFSQLLPADATGVDRVLIVVALTAIGLAWFLIFAWFTSSQQFQRMFQRTTPFIDVAAGLVFLAVAGVVLFEVAASLIAG